MSTFYASAARPLCVGGGTALEVVTDAGHVIRGRSKNRF